MADKGFSERPTVDLSSYSIDPAVLELVPAAAAEKYKLIPLFKLGDKLTVAMAEPRNIMALDEVRRVTKMDLSVVKADLPDIKAAIAEYYGISGVIESVIKDYKPPVGASAKMDAPIQAPIMKLVDVIISQAIKERASDIHIEPEAKDVRIRYRVDGVLHKELNLPLHMMAPVVSRIKVLSGMNIAETRVPQDGRFEIKQEGRAIDLRISTFPTSYGEKAVLRILDKSSMSYKLEDIGFEPKNLERFRKVIKKPHGIILVTGPTGSGKTTTLYAALTEINSEDLNIITVEDPIEYELPGVIQSQVNVKAGLTFASALRSILRQDPDIILLGEIRDIETATIATQASMTGHLVFSTLHTNNAPGALIRLEDMGVEPFLIASSVEAILAQRLVRRICPKCAEKIPAPDEIKEKYPGTKAVLKGAGCKACSRTGYKGRLSILELMVMDEETRKLVNHRASLDEIKKHALSHGMTSMYEDGLAKVKAGLTTMEEILRVTELE